MKAAVCGYGLAAILFFNSGCSKTDPSSPNIIMIIADDMAWDDCGTYGHPDIQTPNIDRLASSGMKFTSAFLTCSSCSPSRSSIITGKYPHNTDAEQLHWPLPPEQITFTELLMEAGYWCAATGKWHLGEAVKDRFDLVVEPGMAGFVLQNPGNNGQASGTAGKNMVAKNKSGCEDWISTLNKRPENRPFFLWLAAFDPHRDYEEGIIPRPHTPQEVRVPPYMPDVDEVRQDLALYYDEIARLDSFVGLVMDELESEGLMDNTLILFMSDNGRPFPRDKTTLYDGGIKTPFIIGWPEVVEAGTICQSLVSSVDIAPTLLEIAGVDIPQQMEGISFRKLLSQPNEQLREYIYAEDHWHDYEDLTRAVRSHRFKYIRNDYPDLPATPSADAGRSISFRAMSGLKEEGKLDPAQLACFISPRPDFEFYDVLADPFELNNLAGDPAYSDQIEQHRLALEAWSQETGFRIPKNRTPDEFDRATGQPTEARIRPRHDKKWFIEKYGIE